MQEKTNESITINKESDDKYKIDWETLKKENPDTVAYLKVNNTNIDYVVVKSDNNDFYLNHNFKKDSNNGGWIFAYNRNKFDGTDKNIVIYGHNNINGSMFGTLKKTLKKEWYSNKNNLTIDVVTEYGLLSYEVFSIYTINKDDYYTQIEFKKDKFMDFLDHIKKKSIYDFNVELNKYDYLLTLSTCDRNKRVVLHAKLIK